MAGGSNLTSCSSSQIPAYTLHTHYTPLPHTSSPPTNTHTVIHIPPHPTTPTHHATRTLHATPTATRRRCGKRRDIRARAADATSERGWWPHLDRHQRAVALVPVRKDAPKAALAQQAEGVRREVRVASAPHGPRARCACPPRPFVTGGHPQRVYLTTCPPWYRDSVAGGACGGSAGTRSAVSPPAPPQSPGSCTEKCPVPTCAAGAGRGEPVRASIRDLLLLLERGLLLCCPHGSSSRGSTRPGDLRSDDKCR